MHNPDRGEEVIYLVPSGSTLFASYSGETFQLHYRFVQLVVNGPADEVSTFVLNGENMSLAGGTVLAHNIRTLDVTSGQSVTVIGIRTSTVLFG